MKPDDDKDHDTNGNTNSEPGDVDNRVVPVTAQTSKGGFKVVFKHKQVVWMSEALLECQFTIYVSLN